MTHERHTMTTDELRARFARKATLSPEHHDALTRVTPTDDRPVVLYTMGTDTPMTERKADR